MLFTWEKAPQSLTWATIDSMSPAATESGSLALDYAHAQLGKATIIHADCLEWFGRIPAGSIHGIVTDPPYGVKEYEFDQIEKLSDHAAEVGGHQHVFQPRDLLSDKLRIHSPQKIGEIHHGMEDMLD